MPLLIAYLYFLTRGGNAPGYSMPDGGTPSKDDWKGEEGGG